MIDKEDFISFLLGKQALASSTVRGHASRIRIFLEWFVEENKSFTAKTIEEYFQVLQADGMSGKGLNNYRALFLKLEEYLVDRNLSSRFMEGFKRFPEAETDIELLTLDEVQSLVSTILIDEKESIEQTNHAFTMLLAYTGCRFEDAQALTCGCVNLKEKKIRFPKTKNGQTRYVYIPESLIIVLEPLLLKKCTNALVFQNSAGGKIHGPDFSRNIKKRARQSGITKKCHPHLLRHCYATYLYLATGDIGMVQIALGHKDIKSTLRYIHLADENIKKAQELHPYFRMSIDPIIFIEEVRKRITNFGLSDDPRFDSSAVYQAINSFTDHLYKAITFV